MARRHTIRPVGAVPAVTESAVLMNADGTPVPAPPINNNASPFEPWAGGPVGNEVLRMLPPVVELVEVVPEAPLVPPDWSPGALLNVRNGGSEYVVTLFPEEYDYQRPERALRFTNPSLCQDFVSNWYARQAHDPRAR